jgi:hypothetical protein
MTPEALTPTVEIKTLFSEEKAKLLLQLESKLREVEAGRKALEDEFEIAKSSKDFSKFYELQKMVKANIYQAERVQRELSGETLTLTISADYTYKDAEGKEIIENIEIDFDKKLALAMKFYVDHKIAVPADFETQMTDIWERNSGVMQEQIEKFGFDEILIIPAGIKLDEALDQEMTKGYKKKDGTAGEPTYWGVKKEEIVSSRGSTNRIIMVHKNKAKDLYNTPDTFPILKETLGKKAGSFKSEEGLTIEEYFLFQRLYYEETGQNLDEKGYTWLPGSRMGTEAGSRVLYAFWDPGRARVGVRAYSPGNSRDAIGCRLSRCFA